MKVETRATAMLHEQTPTPLEKPLSLRQFPYIWN